MTLDVRPSVEFTADQLPGIPHFFCISKCVFLLLVCLLSPFLPHSSCKKRLHVSFSSQANNLEGAGVKLNAIVPLRLFEADIAIAHILDDSL